MPTRFIVVSLPRSGTHMVRTMLNQHPEIRTETELFNEHAKHCRQWRRRSASWVLENIAWRDGAETFQGCLAHLTQGKTWRIWQHLENLRDVRYVCVHRNNLLEQFLSLQQAMVHQRWQMYPNDPCPPVRPMWFTPEELEQYFYQVHQRWNSFDRAFANKPRIDVWYNDLCHRTDSVSCAIQEFLGAPVIHGLQPDTVKVGRPARELIKNYDELCDYFARSPYGHFFHEDRPAQLRMAA